MEYLKVKSWKLFFFYFILATFLMRLNFEAIVFADYANLHFSRNYISSLQSRAQQEMIKVSKWMISNKLTLLLRNVVICW